MNGTKYDYSEYETQHEAPIIGRRSADLELGQYLFDIVSKYGDEYFDIYKDFYREQAGPRSFGRDLRFVDIPDTTTTVSDEILRENYLSSVENLKNMIYMTYDDKTVDLLESAGLFSEGVLGDPDTTWVGSHKDLTQQNSLETLFHEALLHGSGPRHISEESFHGWKHPERARQTSQSVYDMFEKQFIQHLTVGERQDLYNMLYDQVWNKGSNKY